VVAPEGCHIWHVGLEAVAVRGLGALALDELGPLRIGGNAVWESFRRGEIAAIRNYCEADCVNTYLLYLRFQLMRGAFDAARYAEECSLVRAALEKRPEPHWKEFLSLWKT
jgi:hypothetical protein